MTATVGAMLLVEEWEWESGAQELMVAGLQSTSRGRQQVDDDQLIKDSTTTMPVLWVA